MIRKINYLIVLVVALMSAITTSAVSGTYSDPSGGTYWCNVYVSDISDGKSYGWCTGDSEDQKMNEFHRRRRLQSRATTSREISTR